MSAKVILVLCAQAIFVQTAFSSCLGRGTFAAPALIAPGCADKGWAGNGLIGNGYVDNCANNGSIDNGFIGNGLIGNGLAALEIIPTSGGGLPVSSSSAYAPSGLSVASENVYESALFMAGELPFVSAVALEGVLPSGGAAAVSYSCGNDVAAIESITPFAAGYGAAGAYGAGGSYGTAGGYGFSAGYGLEAPAALGFGYADRGCMKSA